MPTSGLQRFINIRFRRYLNYRSKSRGFGRISNKKLYAMGIIIGSSFIRYESNCECLAMKTRTTVFGKTERAVGWEGNGETTGVARWGTVPETLTDNRYAFASGHCLYLRTSTETDMLLPLLSNHSFTLDLVVVHHSHKVIQQVQQVLSKWFAEDGIGIET